MKKSDFKTRIFRLIWGFIPWLMVAAFVVFIIQTAGRINEEKTRLAERKKAAIKKETPAVRVITLTLRPARVTDKLDLPAEVEPYEEVMVKAEAAGQVVHILAEEGQKVKKGDALLQLDDRDYRNRLARIEANYRLAGLEYERNAALIRMKATSKANLDSIEARRRDLKAQLDEAELALDRTRITAPVSCLLNEILAKKGDFVSVGDPVAQILEVDQVKVTVGVPESDVTAVFDLKEAEVVIEALGNLRVKGRKVFFSRQPKNLARLYALELRVPNPDGRILPGMFARVELIKQVFEQALTVPLYAVITRGSERFVYVERSGKAEKMPVQVGALMGWQVHAISGLSPGDRVIVVGHRQLDDGQAVEVIKNVHDPREILKS
jgi:membrane fusion protein (multidrug efflux system)